MATMAFREFVKRTEYNMVAYIIIFSCLLNRSEKKSFITKKIINNRKLYMPSPLGFPNTPRYLPDPNEATFGAKYLRANPIKRVVKAKNINLLKNCSPCSL